MKCYTQTKRFIKASFLIIVTIMLLIIISLICTNLEFINICLGINNQNINNQYDFVSEVIDIDQVNGTELKFDSSKHVFSFILNSDATFCFNKISTKMREKGWVIFPSNVDCSASFYKEEGAYKWAFLNCINVCNQCSVVITVN